jgi:hypothetical protein
MSSEPPPQPISNHFNIADWNRGNNLSISSASYRYLSKVVSDTAQGLISFVQGIKTNTISAFSGFIITIGDGTTTNLNLYSPKLLSALAISSNDTSIVSSSWVKSWFTDILNNSTLTWFQSQNFSGGISTATIQSYFSSVITIGNSSSTANNIWIPVLASTAPANTDNSTKIPSTAWVQSWFANVIDTFSITWVYPQTFFSGIVSNSMNATGTGQNLLIGNNITAGNIIIGQYLNPFGSLQLAGGLNGIANVDVGYMNVNALRMNSLGAINLGDPFDINNGNPTSITNLAITTTRSAVVNIGNGINSTAGVNINDGVGSTGTIVLGNSTTTVAVNAPATFSALPLVSASYAGITGGDTSNTIITTNWLNTVWDTYFITTTNIWSAVQTFSALPLITASYGGITGGNTSNTIITANWLNSTWLPYLRGLANTWSAVQTFSSSISLSQPINPNYSYPVATGLIGERVAGITQSGTTTVVLDNANAQEDIATVDLTRGVWMITAHQTNPNVASSFQLLISSASATRQNTIGEMLVFGNTNASNLTSINVCGTISINASATYYAVSRTSNTGGATLTNVFMYAFRIA